MRVTILYASLLATKSWGLRAGNIADLIFFFFPRASVSINNKKYSASTRSTPWAPAHPGKDSREEMGTRPQSLRGCRCERHGLGQPRSQGLFGSGHDSIFQLPRASHLRVAMYTEIFCSRTSELVLMSNGKSATNLTNAFPPGSLRGGNVVSKMAKKNHSSRSWRERKSNTDTWVWSFNHDGAIITKWSSVTPFRTCRGAVKRLLS